MKTDAELVKLIHIAISGLRLSDATYRDILRLRYRAASCLDLTYKQKSDLLDYFIKDLGFVIRAAGPLSRHAPVSRGRASSTYTNSTPPGAPPRSRRLSSKFTPAEENDKCHPCRPRPAPVKDRPPEEVRYPVTPGQLEDIAQLRRNITWKAANGYYRWLLKFHHTAHVNDSRTAGKVIAGLRGICMQEHHCCLCGAGTEGERINCAAVRRITYGPKERFKLVVGGQRS